MKEKTDKFSTPRNDKPKVNVMASTGVEYVQKSNDNNKEVKQNASIINSFIIKTLWLHRRPVAFKVCRIKLVTDKGSQKTFEKDYAFHFIESLEKTILY